MAAQFTGEGAMRTVEDAVRDLDGKWPEKESLDGRGRIFLTYGFGSHSYWVQRESTLLEGIEQHICTREEFEAAKAKLQNRPSFDDHPDAYCFVQNHDGWWAKNTETDDVSPDADCFVQNDAGTGWYMIAQGEVIGSWRDTLIVNPAKQEKTGPEWTAQSQAEKTLLSMGYEWRGGEYWAPPLGEKPFFADEWVDGMPPVGEVCEYRCKAAMILARDGDSLWVKHLGGKAPFTVYKVGDKFKPLKSERDRAIEAAERIMIECYRNADGPAPSDSLNADDRHTYCAALYDAGLLRAEGKE
jgi:hypothetical protein